MAFSNNRSVRVDRRKRNLNASGVYDTINFILGIGVIVSSIVIFIDYNKYDKVFMIAFLLASLMNFCMGMKYFKRSEMVKAIALFLAGIFLMAMTVLSFLVLW